MTSTCCFRKLSLSIAIAAPAILSFCLVACRSQPQDQVYQPTEDEKRQIEQSAKKTNEAMKTLTTGYGKEMQHVTPDYPTEPISLHRKVTSNQKAAPLPQSNSTQPSEAR